MYEVMRYWDVSSLNGMQRSTPSRRRGGTNQKWVVSRLVVEKSVGPSETC